MRAKRLFYYSSSESRNAIKEGVNSGCTKGKKKLKKKVMVEKALQLKKFMWVPELTKINVKRVSLVPQLIVKDNCRAIIAVALMLVDFDESVNLDRCSFYALAEE